MTPNKLNLWQKLTRFSPITCRLLARRTNAQGRPVAMSDADICSLSGLTLAQVKRILDSLALYYLPTIREKPALEA